MTESINSNTEFIIEDFNSAFEVISANPEWRSPIVPVEPGQSVIVERAVVPETIAIQAFKNLNANRGLRVDLEKLYNEEGFLKSRLIRETSKATASSVTQKSVVLIENNHLYRNVPKCGAAVPVIGLSILTPLRREVFVECTEKFAENYAAKMSRLVDLCIRGY